MPPMASNGETNNHNRQNQEKDMNIRRIPPLLAAVSIALMLTFMVPPPADAVSSSDVAIAKEVRESLGKLGDTVRVWADNGTVFLRGNVLSMRDAVNAEWTARRVNGVRAVNADISYSYHDNGN